MSIPTNVASMAFPKLALDENSLADNHTGTEAITHEIIKDKIKIKIPINR
ncbi:MAG: hypothetical protein MjAS7_1336 [Metallosphaera javensis (ex Sakai et al. 2022)]|nr:MAG: hypothetical protein MjAS7_1336 [Metallosphaera javensis (ex Sakai et al. 2022)]